jgi:TrmH family RNA methyltransferase
MRTAVIVEPEIPENTGFIARLAANFYFELRIVNPDFNLSEARQTAKNAQDKLRDAQIYDTVEDAVEDLDFVVGTKPGRGQKLHEFEPRENTSVMVGRESSGLTNDELELCDAVVEIQTSGYGSINQSHAAAILFSSFNRSETPGLDQGMKDKIRELAPEKTAETIISANPSGSDAGEIIQELLSIREN